MSLPPISGERSGIPRRGQQPRQTKRQNNPANAPYASPESFDDSVSNTGASSTSTAVTAAAAAAAALDRRDASDFRIVVAARIRPFTAREVQQWRRERRAVESPEDVEEARRARAALRQPFGPGHKSLNATQGGLDSTWTRRHDNEEDNTNANGQHGAFDASDVPQPVVEVESDGTTIALLDPQSVAQDGALAPAVRNAFTYDYVYSSFAPNVVLDTQCGPAGRHGNNNSGGNNGAPSPYVILEGDDEGASASERQTSSRHTPAQELQAEAEQVAIYEQLAIPLVDAAMRGYNTCMFAYGQTGSGKTYTMMGTPRHPGLIPRLCRRLFSEITTRNEEGGGLNSTASAASPALVTLQLSYMEIYNEQVRDLLKQRPKNAILHYKSRFDKKDVDSDEYRTLKVRHHPSKGIYVDGLTSVPVRTWDECEAYLQAGNALRTQCSTAMNAKSSRSHAIFQLQMTQRESTGGRVRGREVALETFSKINLVDLAGSERNTQSKTTGKHLAEANSINASLSTLRRVLDGLIANRAAALSGGNGAGGKGKKNAVVIPYRESLLTYVLSDNLGGNSFTVMCANVSPCASSAGETESTLRYATLAKAVVNHAKLNEAPTARVIREMRDQLRVMQEALRSAPDPSHVAALEEGVQLSEALLREMKTREGDYEAQLQAQAEEAAALQEAVETHRRQETYWRDEARRQQREVEELREALFEATQNGAQSSGVHLPSLTDPRGAGAAATKKRSKSQQQQQQSPAKKRRGSSLAVEPASSPSSSGAAAAAAALAAVSARDGRVSRARATPLSLLGDARTKSKKRPSLSTLPEAPASAPDKTRRASLDSGPVVASAPSSGEARALAARTRVNGVMGRPPLPTKGYGDMNDDDVDGTAAADNDFGDKENGEGDVPAFYHTEHFLAVAASDDYADDHAPAAAAAVVPHNAPPHSTYEQLDFTQLQEEALRVGGTSGTFEGGLEIEGVAATPSRRQWPTSSPRVAAARKSQAASDRRRSSTTAAATARQQNSKSKRMKLKKKTGKVGAAVKEGGASRGVSEERAGTEENEGWPPGETSTSFELPSAPAAAASVSASAHAAHAAHHVKSNAVHDTRSSSPHTPHGEEGLTEMHSANPEDQLGGEEQQRRQQRMLSGSSSSVDGFGNVARGVAKVPHHDTDEGDEYEEDYWNAQELTGEEVYADDVDSAAASLNPSSALAANAMPSLHKTTKKTKAGGASHLNTGSSADARHYSTVDTLH